MAPFGSRCCRRHAARERGRAAAHSSWGAATPAPGARRRRRRQRARRARPIASLQQAERDAESLRKEAALEAREKAHELAAEAERAGARAAPGDRRPRAGARRQDPRARRPPRRDRPARTGPPRAREGARRATSSAPPQPPARAEQLVAEQQRELQRVAGLTADEARELLLKQIEGDARRDAANLVKRLETEARETAADRAQQIITDAIQRSAAEHAIETTVSVVDLPSDDLKGRIIGREGRNIRALETATGVELIVQGAQMLLVLLLAPLLTGFTRKVKARLLRRRGPPLLQPYRDLRAAAAQGGRCWPRTPPGCSASIPYMIFAATWVAAALVPTFATGLMFSWSADLIAIIALLGSARFFLALAGMDVGTSFGGIGSSREMMIASLAEPAMIMIVFTLALVAGSTQLSTIAAVHARRTVGLRVSLGLALVALIIVAIAENARIPVDNPATHLELTMVHEAMVLEYSGRHLAMIELAAVAQAAALHLADRLRVRALGPGAGGRPLAAYAVGVRGLSRQARGRRLPAGAVRDVDRQDARVPRAGISRRGADARPARHAAAVRVAELLMHGRLAFDIAHMLAGGLVLVSFMLLYQDRLYRAAQRVRAARRRAVAVGRLAGLHPGRAASLRHGGDRAGLQGDRHPGGAAPDRRAARHPPRDRDGGRHRPDHAGRHGAGRALDGGDAAGDRRTPIRWRARTSPSRSSVVLLGLLMMVTRRNAVSQVVGFMSLENGLVLAATGAKGMPLVVEISVAFSILIAFIVIGIFLFRIRERFDTVDVQALDQFRGERR